MPILPQQALDELKAIHKKNFNEDLTDEQAQAMGSRLLRLYSVLLRVPLPTDEGKDSSPLEPVGKSTKSSV